jgi:Flp pilus assembly pilin Flp
VFCLKQWEIASMRFLCCKIYFGLQVLLTREDGIDLAEFALITCLISVAGMAMLSGIAAKVVGMLTSLQTAW